MQFLNNITVFPSTKTQTLNKLITENSITRLINRLVDVDSYVITPPNQEGDSDILVDVNTSSYGINSLEFCIHGYYFCVNDIRVLLQLSDWVNTIAEYPTTEHSMYARIFIDKTNIDFPEIMGTYNQDVRTDEPVNEGEIFESGTSYIPNFKGYDNTMGIVLLDENETIVSAPGKVTIGDKVDPQEGDTQISGYIFCPEEDGYLQNRSPEDVKYFRIVELNQFDGVQIYVDSPIETNNSNSTSLIMPNDQLFNDNEYEFYDLCLLKWQKPIDAVLVDGEQQFNTYIPLESLHKFTSKSIDIIDGGEIKVS